MGALAATLVMDAVGSAQTFISVFIYVYSLLIFAYVLTSWFRVPYSLSPVQRFLYDVCEPYLRLFRRILPPLGALDLSPIIAIGSLYVLRWLVNSVILDRLH